MSSRNKEYIAQRAIDAALYTIENNATVRQTAKHFGVSKSTIHKDLKQRLPYISHSLYEKVNDIIEVNLHERHIRGGESTRQLYEQLRNYE